VDSDGHARLASLPLFFQGKKHVVCFVDSARPFTLTQLARPQSMFFEKDRKVVMFAQF
jgi:hypothetical protein